MSSSTVLRDGWLPTRKDTIPAGVSRSNAHEGDTTSKRQERQELCSTLSLSIHAMEFHVPSWGDNVARAVSETSDAP